MGTAGSCGCTCWESLPLPLHKVCGCGNSVTNQFITLSTQVTALIQGFRGTGSPRSRGSSEMRAVTAVTKAVT